MVHLLRGRELEFRNALTDNATTRCTKHKKLQTCDNIIGCNRLFYDNVYSSLGTCHGVIQESCKQKYRDFWLHTKDAEYLKIYMFNIVKEYDDTYIEVRKYLDGEVCMTIDAKKIIPTLSVSLEDDGLEKLK